ncbi:hypothetical protein K469DRAFT_708174 [Zopfia rhizophila CBS 207.26]|uniref:Uncharacterized protein n=1 Tax=Zopfia rhizophila CBS 207.26 TaxID=1314779 RepID=A0A6A6E453_9PEZI|nr:hypothetical protein K469DRAFT_708174 [Zopfia rhizophila CBS 207.26]
MHVVNGEWYAGMAKLALNCVGRHVPNGYGGKYWIVEQLIWHANRYLYLSRSELAREDDDVSTLWSFKNLGGLYRHQSKLNEAEEMYRRALEGMEEGT